MCNDGVPKQEPCLFDRRHTYASYYNTLCCFTQPRLDPTSLFGPVGGSGLETLLLLNTCTFEEEPALNPFYWSDSTAIATIGSGSGSASLVGVGSTKLWGRARYYEDVFSYKCPFNLRDDDSPTDVMSPSLSCPSSVTRGQNATCTASATGAPAGSSVTFRTWRFTSGSTTVNRSTSTTSASWAGTMVSSGSVSVEVLVNNQSIGTATRTITVNPRNWHTNPASATQVPNGTIPGGALPVPPQPSPPDSGLGISEERTGDTGFSITILNDNGPNHGFAYHASPLTMSPFFFRYTINPDLENSGSVFSQHQCGNYNATTNPNGFISWNNLITQTRRHEYNSAVQSHHGFYSSALNLSTNNPGGYFEARVAVPGTDLGQFNQTTRSELDARYGRIFSATAIEPFGVNVSETGVFLGYVNYLPYAPCS